MNAVKNIFSLSVLYKSYQDKTLYLQSWIRFIVILYYIIIYINRSMILFADVALCCTIVNQPIIFGDAIFIGYQQIIFVDYETKKSVNKYFALSSYKLDLINTNSVEIKSIFYYIHIQDRLCFSIFTYFCFWISILLLL